MGQNPPQPGLPAQRAAPSRSRNLEGKEPGSHLLTSAVGLHTGDAVLRNTQPQRRTRGLADCVVREGTCSHAHPTWQKESQLRKVAL